MEGPKLEVVINQGVQLAKIIFLKVPPPAAREDPWCHIVTFEHRYN